MMIMISLRVLAKAILFSDNKLKLITENLKFINSVFMLEYYCRRKVMVMFVLRDK